jgi:CRISPR-associated protein Cas2
MEKYYFDTNGGLENDELVDIDKVFVLIIYDVSKTKLRTKLAKLLNGYGFRIQKSAFEAMLSRPKYEKLIKEVGKFIEETDSVRVYKIRGYGSVVNFGKEVDPVAEDVIII